MHVSPYEEMIGGNSFYNTNDDVLENVTHSGKEQMQVLLKRIEKFPLNTKHRFSTINEYIFLVDAIRKQVQEKEIDFIVMGTKGASGLKERTIGSNTGDVITKVKCPTLVIPEKARYTKPKEIAFPTDYNIYYRSKVLTTLTEILSFNKSTFRVVHVARKEKELTSLQKKNKDFLNDYLGDEIEHSFHSLSNPKIEEAIQCFCRE